MGGELSVAKNIQREMLPKTFPPDIFGMVEPAREVGGDLFDFFFRDGKLFFCIGDVSGKGAPSAMLMSVIHSLFRLVAKRVESPALIIRELNEQICPGNDSNMFVTFFVGVLDMYRGKLHFCNAGHDKPFLLTSAVELLQAKANLPLGVFSKTEFEEQSIDMAPGDSIFLYTDGLTEARNVSRAAFGRSGVEEVLNNCARTPRMTARMLVDTMSDAVHGFAGSAPQSDDLTMLLIRYEPGEIVRDSIELVNRKEEVAKLSGFTKAFCAALDLDGRQASGLRLALEEAVANVICYAYPEGEEGKVSIYAESNRREVRFTVVDSGFPFDPTAALPTDTSLDAGSRQIGGLGIHLTRKLMDSVSYRREAGNNILTLTKSII